MKASVSPWGEGRHREDYIASNGERYAILAEKTVGDQYGVKVIPYQKEGEANKHSEPILQYLRIMSDPKDIIKEAGEVVLEEHLKKKA
jgi:hypothetical protein